MSGRLKIKLFALITFINVAIGVIVGELLCAIWPESYFEWYPSIPIFYWIMALAMVFFLDKVKREKGDVSVTTYMLVRCCKLLMACIFLLVYASYVGTQLRSFGLTLMIFYFIYLILELYTVYLYEKKRMKREEKEQDGQNKL